MQKNSDYRVILLGAIGSISVSGPEFQKYGGATSSVLLQTPELEIVLDAGTGIINLPLYSKKKKIHLFLSHYHLDHLMGLPMCPAVFHPETEMTIYAPDILPDLPGALEGIFHPPYWPVGVDSLPAKIQYKSVKNEINIEDSPMKVRTLPLRHPKGCSAYRFDFPGGSLVYATDCEPDEDGKKQLQEFSKGSELLVLDAQYTREEYERNKGFGHTTAQTAVELMSAGGIKRCALFHHAPGRTDEQIEQMEKEIQQLDSRIFYARERMDIEL